ncbi:MAG TPA: penicillin acylase family protein [Actinotalea sp.]
MPRRRAARVLVGVAAVLVIALVATVALVTNLIRRPLPEHSGTLEVPGLQGEVRVLRDARGVPSIYADSADDLFRAQGYVHAQDRFFEMDYRRHVTSGRLSELVGQNEDALKADKVIRTFGWSRVAKQEWALLTPETRDHLQAYADGVNAYLDQRDPASLALEYTVLGRIVDVPAPEHWDPIDSLAWLKAMAWDLRGNYDDELGRALAYSTVRDVARVEDLYPSYPQATNAPILASGTVAQPAAHALPTAPMLGGDLTAALEATSRALAAVPHLIGSGDGTGSNSWVVSGDHTASGLPILANDPHLSISAPGIWMQMGLYCNEVTPDCPFAVSGFTFSGFPGVIIGHNAQLAWGLTNLGADVTDFFVEHTNRSAGTYERDGKQVPLDLRREVIKVNGAADVSLAVRSTVHGPIISDVLEVGPAATVPLASGGRGTAEVALGWTALEPGRTADAVFAFDTAKDAADIASAAKDFAVPSQNIVYATTDGHIGYQAPGRIPVRAVVTDGPVPSDGTWPRPGWDSRYDWQGYVDPAAMPAAQDPAEGYVVAANQAVTPAGEGPFLTSDWDYGYRAQRIRDRLDELIASKTPIDVATTSELQNDTKSPYAKVLVPALLAVPVQDAFTSQGVDLLRGWDGRQDADSPAAAYFADVWATILQLTFQDDLPEVEWPNGNSRWLQVVSRLLEQPDSPWWDDRRTVNVVESRDSVLAQALVTARAELTVRLGKDVQGWRWGQLHSFAPQHAVLGGPDIPNLIRELVNPEPIGVAGSSAIVDATAWDAASGSFDVTAAPSMRMVVDLSDLDGSTWVAMTGTSGHPGSVHYTDQLEAWGSGKTFPWPFSAPAVETSTAHTLTLVPGTSGS